MRNLYKVLADFLPDRLSAAHPAFKNKSIIFYPLNAGWGDSSSVQYKAEWWIVLYRQFAKYKTVEEKINPIKSGSPDESFPLSLLNGMMLIKAIIF